MACRYMRVYNAAIKDRAFTYAIFFLFFFIHIVFCVWSAISPPLPFSNDWSHTGFMCAIKAFGSNTFVGVIFILGACFWTLETLWSLWCLKMVGDSGLPIHLHFESHPSLDPDMPCTCTTLVPTCLGLTAVCMVRMLSASQSHQASHLASGDAPAVGV